MSKVFKNVITKSYRLILLLILFLPGIRNSIFAQPAANIPVMNFQQFEPTLHYSNDTIYIINFWATWCVPCRKELPEFEKIHKDFSGQKVKVILTSLDFPKQIENSLIPFLEKNNITADVILLNDPNSNVWIDKVDTSWSGSLPATLIYNSSGRQFFEKELNYESIKNIIQMLNNH